MPDQTVVLFGNDYPQMQVTIDNEDGTSRQISVPAEHLKQSETRVTMASDFDDQDLVEHSLSTDNDRLLSMIGRNLAKGDKRYAVGIGQMEQVVDKHTGGMKPSWISSTDTDFQRVLCEHFGVPAGQPVALLTTVGRDALHGQSIATAAQPAAFSYLALADSASATTPAAGNTTLAGEITTSAGGLKRKQGTVAHTAGTNTSTITATFTANGSDTLPVTVSQSGVFNDPTAGTLGFKDALSANATLTVSGDNVTITWTGTIG